MSNHPKHAQGEAGYIVTIPGRLADFKLTIPGRLPGLNEYTEETRANRYKGAEMKRHYQNIIGWHIRAQLHGITFARPVYLLFTFYEQDRRRDRDNVGSFARKIIQDALVACGVLQDDSWGCVTGYLDSWSVDAKNPRIEVRFIEQEGKITCKERQKKSSRSSKR